MAEGFVETGEPTKKYLPPRELWLHNPYRDGRIPTPVDDRGIVLFDELIDTVVDTVDPSYSWTSPFNDKHHLEWPSRWYDARRSEPFSPQTYRNLPINLVITPRVFHNWVHEITVPPKVPSKDVMQYRVDAQRVALSLFRTVAYAKRKARERNLQYDGLEELLMRKFDGFGEKLEIARAIPPEFQLINPNDYNMRGPQDMLRIAKHLGRFSQPATVVERLRQPVAA